MTVAYLIVAHEAPHHLARLLAALRGHDSRIFVHLDAKSDAADFTGLAGDGVFFLPGRQRVYWADYSQVEAALRLLSTAYADPCRCDRFVLISGVDYPVRSASYIARYFAERPEQEFIDLAAVSSSGWGKSLLRLSVYRLRPPGERSIREQALRLLMKARIVPRDRDVTAGLGGLVPYGGDAWWALSRAAAGYVLDFVRQNPAVMEFFRHTFCPDEHVFQTIIGGSPFAARVAGGFTFVEWSSGGSHPAIISERHLDLLAPCSALSERRRREGREILFARKFADDSSALVAAIARRTLEDEVRLGRTPA